MKKKKDIINQAVILDKKLLGLIEKRLNLVKEVDVNDYNLILKLRDSLAGNFCQAKDKKMIENIFENIHDHGVSNRYIKVAFLGPNATNSHQSAQKIFGKTAKYYPQPTIFDIFKYVENEEAEFGVVPIENSIEGAINSTLDFLKDSKLQIYGEETINIAHNLISFGSLKSIKVVYSHPQILGQCREWLRNNLPKAQQIEAPSSAQAVKMIGKSKQKASIGTKLAAKIMKAPVIAEDIQDYKSNKTRFLILSYQNRKKGRKNKTSLVFLCHDKPGSLVEVLKIFKSYNINLTKIESRPSKKKDWEYYFFVDLIGHEGDPKVIKALNDIAKSTVFLKILGSYPVK